MYAAKNLSDDSIVIIQCKGDPEQFLAFRMEQSGAGTEEDPIIETKVMEQELIGEVSKDAEGQYQLPDRAFRGSWRDNAGSIETDMPLARLEKMDQIRAQRDELLKKSDEVYVALLSQGADLTAINALKSALRDVPQNTDLSGEADEAALKAVDPIAAIDTSLID